MNASPKKTVLIVDDCPENLEILASILATDYEVMAAKNGEKALAIARTTQGPDLILLDIVMPEMDGLEVCRHLKSDPATRDIPVIFVTSQSDAADEARGLEIGGVDYLSKPVSPQIVLARVKTHMDLSSATRDLITKNHTLQENIRLLEQIEQIARHDLKGPLTIFMNASDYLEQEKNLSAHQLSFLKMLDESAVKMLRMIDSTLDLFKMERGQYKVKSVPVDVVKAVSLVQKELETQAKEKGVECSANLNGHSLNESDSMLVQGDSILYSTIVSNLVKNAIEASPEGEKVVISMTGGDQTKIEVKNQGVIPAEIRPCFMERFATAGKQTGTGLGAYSARLMARTLGGDISFVSGQETGTIITVSIPHQMPDCQKMENHEKEMETGR